MALEDLRDEERALPGLDCVEQATWVLSNQLVEIKDILESLMEVGLLKRRHLSLPSTEC